MSKIVLCKVDVAMVISGLKAEKKEKDLLAWMPLGALFGK